jgi:hypothetical protein
MYMNRNSSERYRANCASLHCVKLVAIDIYQRCMCSCQLSSLVVRSIASMYMPVLT